MTVSWVGFPGVRAIDEEERRAIDAVLERRTLYRGAGLVPPVEVRDGERELREGLQRKFAILMNSGTSALLSALVAGGIGEGDEVIVPGYGWLTDVSVVLERRAVPVFAPVGEDLTIDVARLAECITPSTRAIAPVHACGRPYDVAGVAEFAQRHGLMVIEDACQALGARVHDRPAGAFGDMTALSFQAFKLVSGGEGGALLTDDPSLYEKAFRFHDAGLSRFAEGAGPEGLVPTGLGLNLRMSELTAALVRVQLRRLPHVMARLQEARDALLGALGDALGAGALRLPRPRPGSVDNGTFLVLRADEPAIARTFLDTMRERGCAIRLASEASLHALPGWLDYLRREKFAHRVVGRDVAEAALQRALILEINWQQTPEMLDTLHEAAREGLRRT